MIKVTFCPKRFYIKVKGHSKTAPSGQDIVCAAATMLVYTLGESVIENQGLLNKRPDVDIKKGEARISCSPKPDGRRDIETVFNTVLCGFRLLAESYPKAVKIEKKL